MIYFYLQVHTYQQPDWFRFSFINVRIWLRWNNVNTMLQQRCTKLFWNCFNVCLRRCINFVQCWKSDVGFCFIFNVGTMLFQRLCTALKQSWSDVELLVGAEYSAFLRESYGLYDSLTQRGRYFFLKKALVPNPRYCFTLVH